MPIETLGFDHVDLTVNDLERSAPFYEKVLGKLGFRRVDGPGDSIVLHNGVTSLGIHGASAQARGASFDRHRVGLHHLALRAARRSDVDDFHAFLLDEQVSVLDAPTEYPEYGPHYYAVFFADPDGLKLELVHFPWGYWRRVLTDGEDARPRYPRGAPRT